MATIERIEVTVAGPDVRRTTWAGMAPQFLALTVVHIWDSDGAEGVGASQSYGSGLFDRSAFEGTRVLAPLIVGRDSGQLEARWRDLQTDVLSSPAGAVGAIDIALWDLAARRAQLPLYRFLGARRDTIPAYASTEELPEIDDYLQLVANLRDAGFHAVKFHAWNEVERDLRMLRAVHDAYGDSGLQFMHDAETRYDRIGAVRAAKELGAMGFRWLEAPLNDFDVEGYLHIRKAASVPLLPCGLWITDLRELLFYLRHGLWDAVRFDTCSIGGITLSRKMCALAEAFGLRCEPQSWGYSLIQLANLHIALSVANATFFELPVPYDAYEYAVQNPIRLIDGGHVTAPQEPGLGAIMDWHQVEAHSLGGFVVKRNDAIPTPPSHD